MSKQKWTNNLGPRKAKPILELISKLEWERTATEEISGIIGGEERRSISHILCGAPTNLKAVELLQAIGERYGCEINPKNSQALEADLVAALVEAKTGRKIEDNRRTPAEVDETARFATEQREKYEARREAWKACYADLARQRPVDAVALIVAELNQDQSDMMSDYHAHSTTRRVAIGWRRGKREDFAQLRVAAATFEETKHLGPGCEVWRIVARGTRRFTSEKQFATQEAAQTWLNESLTPSDQIEAGYEIIPYESVEHRENYSMGAGNYLKAGWKHNNGWMVRSYEFDRLSFDDALEIHLSEAGSGLPAPSAQPATPSTGCLDASL